MEKKFVGAGLGAGLIAGIIAFVFARIFVEPLVSRAIGYEDGRSEAEERLSGEHGHEHEVFTRGIQENIGAGIGSVMFGVAMGAILAVVFTIAWSFIGRRYPFADARLVAGGLALAGFLSVYLIPFFKYPANPPAVGEPDTIGDRTSSYLTMTGLSVLFAIIAIVGGIWLIPRIGGLWSLLAGIAGYAVAVGITMAALPIFDEIPTPLTDKGAIAYPGFPADLLGEFRYLSIGNQMIMWAVLGLIFAGMLSWMGKRSAARADAPAVAVAS